MFKRFLKYAVVGLQISILHWSILFILTEYAGLWYMASTIITSVSASLFGFMMNSIWTWKNQAQVNLRLLPMVVSRWHRPKEFVKMLWQSRFVRYYIVGVLGVLLGWTQVYVYTEYLGLYYMLSSALGTIVVMSTTFIAREKWVYVKTA
jgi:putative flippase GtrA